MNSKRVFFLMIAGIVLLGVGLVAATVLGDVMLQKQSKKLVSLKLDNDVLDQQQLALTQAKKDVVKYTSLEQIAKSIVPEEKDQAETVREIVGIANQNGIKLGTISFPASTLGLPPVKAAPGTPASPSSLTQVKPVSGISGVYVMELTIQSDTNNPVSYDKFINFLQGLEQNRRTAQVTSVIVQPFPQDRSKLTFTLTVDVYLKP